LERPAEALLEREKLLQRRPRDGDHRDIPVREVNHVSLEVVRPERAALAADLRVRAEHEMINHELRAALEEILEGLLAARAVEDVALVHALPGERAARFGERFTRLREFLFLCEERLACNSPVCGANDRVCRHIDTLFPPRAEPRDASFL